MSETGIFKKLSDFFIAPTKIDPDELKERLGEDDPALLTVPTLSCTH